MQMRLLRLGVRIALVGLLGASLSGCYLYFTLGHVKTISTLGEEIDNISATIVAHATAGICTYAISPPFNHDVGCSYFVDGQEISSTVELLSAFGIYGALIDPLILEVPADISSVTATYDRGGGPQLLPVGRADSFPVNPSTRITAEVGTTFLILDLPGDVAAALPGDPSQGSDLNFSLAYNRTVPHGPHAPMTIKPMTAGLVIVRNQRYYIPLLPCVTDFADVPAVTIPEANTPQHLEMALGDLIRNHDANPCNHVVHDFNAAALPPGLVFAPLVRR